ncbi:tRNA lysidine(34) synthetase TilS [Couchioplanes caeruleus]|uniref:tRNA(Ile)-lysidine synthase n=2 Tax=Couchioplanes caeruleus TaxID=56438 RepID=A0A1K0FME9_9ACTN|nr:tRNA lysidine(34) synthetase TilS [Couchioplanes caeruleus]OJF13904.1 tRNA lysidine(34) synthetase TilS [Couchioplanes caeruleus subsp. caeruleus]ROP31523.1 tRNA(Ile)-lysidine synthase [Couchioplanes caeruleus]
MARIPPPVATVRAAVRRELTSGPVLVACSGGADSLALAAAAAFVAPRLGIAAGLVTVDHGLQDGSAARAASVAQWGRAAGFDPVEVATVDVAGRPGGPEAAARDARYEALSAAAQRSGATVVLLGHTRDDQAETVLLALARGAGPRGLAGMPRRKGLFVRPLLDVSRADTRGACAALGLAAWEDPHNADPAYARARVRADALPALAAALGPAVVANLARTASLLAADVAYLDEVAAEALATARTSAGLSVTALSRLPEAIRGRVLHAWAAELGAPGAALSHRHVAALDALVTGWHGQGPAALPEGILVARRAGDLVRASL